MAPRAVYSMFRTICRRGATAPWRPLSKLELAVMKGDMSMKKAILLSAALLLCTALAIAQDTPQSGGSTNQTPATSSSDQTSTPSSGSAIQGCLSGSSGNYMLTDTSGTMWQLTGDESQLSANVNKQVEVMGTASAGGSAESHTPPDSNASGNSAEASGTSGSASASAGGASGSASANSTKTLAVTTVRKVADSCSMSK